MRSKGETKPLSIGPLHQVGGELLTHPFDSNCFILQGEPLVMIEAGSRLGSSAIQKVLAEKSLCFAEVKIVLATHCHWDHVSGFEAISDESDAELMVPRNDAETVAAGDSEGELADYYGQMAHPLTVGVKIDDGFCIETSTARITAIETPGHTLGSVCFEVSIKDGPNILLMGDTVHSYYFPSTRRSIDEDIKVYRESLCRLRSGKYDYMAMGHAVMGFLDDTSTRLEEAQRQFANPDVLKFIEENVENLPRYIDLYKKPNGQIFKY